MSNPNVRRLHPSILISLVILPLLVSGCTHLYEQPIHQVTLPPAREKLDLSVDLILTDEFRNEKWVREFMGDTFIVPAGENLVYHSEQLVKNVFTKPMVIQADARASKVSEAGYFLEPKVVFFDITRGVSAFSDAKTSISVEWKLSARSGKTIWIETIQGVGKGITGGGFAGGGHEAKRLKAALQDLFTKTQNAMLTSKVLRNLSQIVGSRPIAL